MAVAVAGAGGGAGGAVPAVAGELVGAGGAGGVGGARAALRGRQSSDARWPARATNRHANLSNSGKLLFPRTVKHSAGPGPVRPPTLPHRLLSHDSKRPSPSRWGSRPPGPAATSCTAMVRTYWLAHIQIDPKVSCLRNGLRKSFKPK